MSRLPNKWILHPAREPRIEGLLPISWAISDAFDAVTGHLEVDGDGELRSDWTPLELAARMKEAAERIEAATDESLPTRLANRRNGRRAAVGAPRQ